MSLVSMKFKILSAEHSRAIQELLFELGFAWHTGSTSVEDENERYLYATVTDTKKSIGHGETVALFSSRRTHKETTLKELQELLNQQNTTPHAGERKKAPYEELNYKVSDEFDTNPAPTPTLDQLLQDWRSVDEVARLKRDEANAMWQAVKARANQLGVTVTDSLEA